MVDIVDSSGWSSGSWLISYSGSEREILICFELTIAVNLNRAFVAALNRIWDSLFACSVLSQTLEISIATPLIRSRTLKSVLTGLVGFLWMITSNSFRDISSLYLYNETC